MILLAALLLGGFLMYRWKKRKERQAEIEAKLEKERQEKEKQRRLEEEKRRAEEAERLAQAQALAEAQAAEAAQREKEIEEGNIPDDLTDEEREKLTKRQAILKFIEEKPAEAAMLVKLWLTEDE